MARNTRSSAPVLKIAAAVLMMLVLIGGALLYLQDRGGSASTAGSAAPSPAPAAESEAAPPDQPQASAEEPPAEADPAAERIAAIVALAGQGRIDTADFTVGRTSLGEVERSWQSADQTSANGSSTYAKYAAHATTIGYKNKVVTDLRSNEESLAEIRYRDILDTLGEADSVNTYKDDTVNQLILGYDLPGGYTLRWVLPKPWAGEGDTAEENPPLDHISLVGRASKPAASGESPASTEAANGETAAPPTDGGSAATGTAPAAGAEAAADGSTPPTAAPAAPAPAAASDTADLLAGLTLDEKIGQMVIAGVEGTSLREEDRALIRDYGVSGVIFYADNIDSAAQTKTFVAEVKAANPNGELPLLVSVDQEGGRVARLKGVDKIPTAGAIGERGDAAYARSIGEQLGDQLLSQGFNLDYAPVLDVNSNPDNPVIGDRSFGADAALVSKLGIPVMQGLESKNVIPVVKHFPGHGDTSVDSHIALPVVDKSLEQLDKLELIPFKKAIAAQADVVMIAHILLPKLDKQFPSSLSAAVMTDLLRGKLGFDGVIMTDDMTMGAIADNYGIGEAAVQSVAAGSDIVLVAHGADNAIDSIEAIKQAVRSGQISESRIDESAARILALKKKYLK